MDNKVLIIGKDEIKSLGITPDTCLKWIEESFKSKYDAILPPKISIHPQGNDFFNTMPCCTLQSYNQ